jgi:2,3-dihydroxyphenylpropionate 1,2-dioxygenase
MVRIVGAACLSHSPFWDRSFAVDGPGALFVSGVAAIRDRVARIAPDVVVVFGPDHFRGFFYDAFPPFCIGTGAVDAVGDYDCPQGPLPVLPAMARALYDGVAARGFDPAYSVAMRVDHGIVQPYAVLAPALDIPMIPIMMGVNGKPRPGFDRCYAFGRAVGGALRALPDDAKVMLLASGGLSHWVPSAALDDPTLSEDRRDYLINGRSRMTAYSAQRDVSVRERRATVDGRVNAAWDERLLSLLAEGKIEPILSWSQDVIEDQAGNGAHEIGAWLALAAAWGGRLDRIAYEPVSRWATGMGCIAAFQD